MSDHEPDTQAGQLPGDAVGVVAEVADILGSYLATDSSFTPEMAIERVRTVINSRAGMSAFLQDALRPGVASAEAVVMSLAKALDDHQPTPEETVLKLVEIIESPAAVELYDREMLGRD